MAQGNRSKTSRKPALRRAYTSPNQLTIEEFITPFEQALTKENRWVKLAHLIPWDGIVSQYEKQFKSKEGRRPVNGRVVLGAVIIKHLLNISDRETIQQITENMFIKYFLGYSSFTNEEPFSASLFVDIRNRLNHKIVGQINDIVIAHALEQAQPYPMQNDKNEGSGNPPDTDNKIEKTLGSVSEKTDEPPKVTHEGKLIVDATVAPQNITFPTDLKLLNAARVKSETFVDKLYRKDLHGDTKPRTYREIARKDFVNAQKKKNKTHKEIYKANGKQLRFLKRDLAIVETLLNAYRKLGIDTPLGAKDFNYLDTLRTVYELQKTHFTKTEVRA